MEIGKPRPLARDFWTIYIKKTIRLTIFLQLVIVAVIGVILYITKTFESNLFLALIIIIAVMFTSILFNILLILHASKPTKDLISAIVNVISDESSILTPPNPNLDKYQDNGLSDAFLSLYKLSSKPETDAITADRKQLSILKAIATAKCGFVVMDGQGKIIYANKSAPTRVDTENNLSLNLFFNGTDNLDTWIQDCQNNSLKASRMWTRIPNNLSNQEDRKFFDVIASYEKDVEDEITIICIDKTEEYIVDEESLDFLSFAAHELRGPITVVRGYLEVLEDELKDQLKNDQLELFKRLTVSSNRLSGYINNILNTSRYDRRHLKVFLEESTVEKLYDIIKDDMNLRAGSQNRLLSVDIPTDLPTIAVDLASMSEVLGNLIDNAIKYSNEGGAIEVSAKILGNFVEVSVKDHGIGMPDSVVSNLFQKFYRSHRSRETVAGTGIGLYISKAIVESHGGNIGVRSEDGMGSTFTVAIPIYSTVADKLKGVDNSNEGLISEGKGWIKNHSMYRG